jgi:hypothetical protein
MFHFHSFAKINDGDYGVEVAAEVAGDPPQAILKDVWLYGLSILGRLKEEQKRLLGEVALRYWEERVREKKP